MTNPLWIKQQMSLRRLAKQFVSHVQSVEATKVLVTSFGSGDGKATFINGLYNELEKMGENLFIPLEGAQLKEASPDDYRDQMVIVHGPAYSDIDGLHTLPERWLNAFDAAVVIVLVRHTRHKELKRLVDWLKTYHIQHVWLLWNERSAPPFEHIIPRLKRRFGIGRTAPRTLNEIALEPTTAEPSGSDTEEETASDRTSDSALPVGQRSEPAFVAETVAVSKMVNITGSTSTSSHPPAAASDTTAASLKKDG